MTTLVSLEPMVPLAFLGLFLASGAPHGLTRLLMFPRACPRLLGTPSPFDAGLHAFSDKVKGGASPMVVFPDTAFHPHNDATMITIPDNSNGFIGSLNTHGGSLLPLLASGLADTKNVNVSFMTWVHPCYVHLFLGLCLMPHAAAIAGITAVENDGTWAQAQPLMDWLMVLTCPRNATSPTPWVLFMTDMTAPVGDSRFTGWRHNYFGQILPTLAGTMAGVGGPTSQIATLMGDLLNVQRRQCSNAQAVHTVASQPKTVSEFLLGPNNTTVYHSAEMH